MASVGYNHGSHSRLATGFVMEAIFIIAVLRVWLGGLGEAGNMNIFENENKALQDDFDRSSVVKHWVLVCDS